MNDKYQTIAGISAILASVLIVVGVSFLLSNSKEQEPKIIIVGFVTWGKEIIPTVVELETKNKVGITWESTQHTQRGIFLFEINKTNFKIYATDRQGNEWKSSFVVRDTITEFYEYFDGSLIKEIKKTDDLILIILDLNKINNYP